MNINVLMPQVNVNEDEILLVEWLKESKERVLIGEEIARLETTKSVQDLCSDGEGYLHILRESGSKFLVGERLAVISDNPDLDISQLKNEPEQCSKRILKKKNGKLTKKALLIIKRENIDQEEIVNELQHLDVITEDDVKKYILKTQDTKKHITKSPPTVKKNKDAERIAIIGGGMAAVQILDTLSRVSHQIPACILDDEHGLLDKEVMGCRVEGCIGDVRKVQKKIGFDTCIIAINNPIELRKKIFEDLKGQGVKFANIVDPSVSIGKYVEMGEGNVILSQCQVGAFTSVGDNNFLSAFVDIEHHNILGNHCNFGPGVMTSGEVILGSVVKFGTGIFIEPKVRIGDDCRIASGVVLTQNVPDQSIVKTKPNYIIRPKIM